MKLISEEYRELNKQLHASRNDYGTSGSFWAQTIEGLLLEDDTVLDYGCGKGTLKDVLSVDVSEYDPAIPGKDGDPEPASLVVCTDVMEHIEPDLIDKVISHIYSKTTRIAFFVIATRPAKKFLADGRNAHLIIEDSEWWIEKLSKHFSPTFVKADDRELVYIGQPIRELMLIPGKGAIPDGIRNEQMRQCLARKPKRLELPEDGVTTHKTAVLVCYGPSLKYSVEKIRKLQQDGAVIVTCSGAHDFLIEHGIKPDIHSDIDGRAHKAALIKQPQHGVKYLMATVCHPDYFDKLEGFDVEVFHIHNTEATATWIDENDPGAWMLTGGITIGNRLLGLLFHMGYRTAHVFGMDCSYGFEGERHAGVHTGKEQRQMKVRCGDIWFTSSPQMISAARDMIEILEVLNPIGYDVTFHGNGLLQAMIAQATGLTGNE